MRKVVSIALLLITVSAVTTSIYAASYVQIFSREIELPDECLFSPNLNDAPNFGGWLCGLTAGNYGGRIILEEKRISEQGKPWNFEEKIDERRIKSGDISLLRFDILHEGRKLQVAFVCDDTTCLKVLGSRNEQWVDTFIEQFHFHNESTEGHNH